MFSSDDYLMALATPAGCLLSPWAHVLAWRFSGSCKEGSCATDVCEVFERCRHCEMERLQGCEERQEGKMR